jgi:hypothetical protein
MSRSMVKSGKYLSRDADGNEIGVGGAVSPPE